jgi:hypothetical protein
MRDGPHAVLWQLIASNPELLLRHVGAYVALIEEHGARQMHSLKSAVVRQVGGVVALITATIGIEVAAMLWVANPALGSTAALLLFVLPCMALGVALYLMLPRPAPKERRLLEILQSQLRADLALLVPEGETP